MNNGIHAYVNGPNNRVSYVIMKKLKKKKT